MELLLNLAWALLTLGSLAWWVCARAREGSDRRAQLVALGMLSLVLFPVISVTDDYWAAQNPAEADTCLRRHEASEHRHAIVPEIPLILHERAAGFVLISLGRAPLDELPPSLPQLGCRANLYTRPPPTA